MKPSNVYSYEPLRFLKNLQNVIIGIFIGLGLSEHRTIFYYIALFLIDMFVGFVIKEIEKRIY